MPRKSLENLKNLKLSPWATEAFEHWRWLEDQLDPLPIVTARPGDAFWGDDVWGRGFRLPSERATKAS